MGSPVGGNGEPGLFTVGELVEEVLARASAEGPFALEGSSSVENLERPSAILSFLPLRGPRPGLPPATSSSGRTRRRLRMGLLFPPLGSASGGR